MSYLVAMAAIMVMGVSLAHGFYAPAMKVGLLALVWVGLTPTVK